MAAPEHALMPASTPTHIVIHTDGACSCNPGPGGWGAIISYLDDDDTQLDRIELSGGEAQTTNNRMEIMAAVAALNHLKDNDGNALSLPITIFSDSKYLVNGFMLWLPKWKVTRWRGSGNKPVKNPDLWKALDALTAPLTLAFEWVEGHAGDPDNEAADALASAAIPERTGF